MSNNNKDEPNEYDVIFDNSNSDSDRQTTIEVSDGEEIKPRDYIDVEELEIPTSAPEENLDGEDGDIEEGIFAPVRKERSAGKKTAPLMWAVSLLAFVGVGSFVYVTNPDIFSKVTQNIGSENVAVAPDATVVADTVPEQHEEVSLTPLASADPAVPPTLDPNIPPTTPGAPASDIVTPSVDNVVENTNNVPPDVPADTPVTNPTATEPVVATDTTSVTPTPVSADEATATATPTHTSVTASIDNTAPPTAQNSPSAVSNVAPEPVSEKIAPPSMDVATTATPTDMGVTPPIEGAKNVTAGSAPIEAAPDVIAPTNDFEEEGADTASTQPTTSVVSAPAPDAATLSKATENTATKTPKDSPASKEKEAAPTVVTSKEEKKRLDDAKLDQYFDSPGGHILSMIPAPSMNVKKGGNESIIIVNKKGSSGSKTATSPPPKSKNVVIETTTLDTQLVSANRAMKLGRYEAAKEMYDELYKLNPRDAKILAGRAIVLQKMGMADQAINAYEELLKIYPDNADAIVNWSGLIRKQYPAVALNKLLDLHMSQPNNNVVTAQLGVANADAGNYPDAVRYLGDAAAAEPKNPLHLYNLAVVSEKAGKRDQAVTYYEKALEVDAIYGDGQNTVPREKIYDRLAQIRGN